MSTTERTSCSSWAPTVQVRWYPPWGGPERTHHVLENTPVSSLRDLVSRDCGLPATDVLLRLVGRLLDDDETMSSVGYQEDQVIWAHRTPPEEGGPQTAPSAWAGKDEPGKSYFMWTQQSSDFTPPHPGKAPLPQCEPAAQGADTDAVRLALEAALARAEKAGAKGPVLAAAAAKAREALEALEGARAPNALEGARAPGSPLLPLGLGLADRVPPHKGGRPMVLADTMSAPEHRPRVCEVLNSYDGTTATGGDGSEYHFLKRYDLVVDDQRVPDEGGWANVCFDGRRAWAPRDHLKVLPRLPAIVSLAPHCSPCAPLVNVVRLPLPELMAPAPLAVCVFASGGYSNFMMPPRPLFNHFSGKDRILEKNAINVTTNEVMRCQFASFGGPWADRRSWYILGNIERPDRPTSWAVGVGYNKKQYYCLALHFAMALTLAQEIPDDDLLKFGCGFRELVLQVTK